MYIASSIVFKNRLASNKPSWYYQSGHHCVSVNNPAERDQRSGAISGVASGLLRVLEKTTYLSVVECHPHALFTSQDRCEY